MEGNQLEKARVKQKLIILLEQVSQLQEKIFVLLLQTQDKAQAIASILGSHLKLINYQKLQLSP
jgi:hypothetical protein